MTIAVPAADDTSAAGIAFVMILLVIHN